MSESSLVLLNRASMLVLKGLLQDALDLLETAIREFPFDPRPLERTAELYRGLGRTQEAVKAYLAAADLYAQAGTPVRALDLCKRVLELDPQNSKAHRILKNAPPPRDENEFLFNEIDDGSTLMSDQSVPVEFEATTVSSQSIEFESTSVTNIPVPDFDELTPTMPRDLAQPFIKESSKKTAPPIVKTESIAAKPQPATTRAVPIKPEIPKSGGLVVRRSAYSVPPQKETPPTGIQLSRLPSIPLFAELPPKAFREVLGAAIRKQFKQREIICREGEPGKSCFIILFGEVDVWKLLPTGRRSIARLSTGDFFGEMASISQLPRSATVEALKQTEVLEVPWDIVSRLANEHKPVETVLHRFYKRRVLDNLALSSALFSAFSSEERETLVRSFVIREAKVNERLLAEGAHASGFYVLLSASCDMLSTNAQRKPVLLQKLRAGDFFGGGSILESRPALATVQVTEAGRVLYFARKSFSEVMQSHPAARAAVAPLLAERRRLAEQAKQNEPLAGGRIEMP